MPKPAREDLPYDKIVEQYQAGASLRWLADHYSCASSTVRRVLWRRNIQLRRRGEPRPPTAATEFQARPRPGSTVRRSVTLPHDELMRLRAAVGLPTDGTLPVF